MSRLKVISAVVFVYQLFLILQMKMFKKKGTEGKETSVCWKEKKISEQMKGSVDRNN